MTTVELAAQMVRALLAGAGAGAGVEDGGKGLQGWQESVAVYDGEGYAVGRVYFGGRTDVHVHATSAAADIARPLVTGLYGAKTSRVDTRVDTLVAFDDLAALLEEAAAGYGSVITRMESKVRGESTGRTVYLGAPTSAIRVRLYEKWLESPGQYVEGTNRVEVQLRPASRVKGVVSGWTPAETFCASRVTRHLADKLTNEYAPTKTLHVARGVPELERTLAVMGDQYARAVDRWLWHSGGDVGRVLDHLGLPVTAVSAEHGAARRIAARS